MKIAISAGHYLKTSGRKTIGSNSKKEWELNHEVAKHLETMLKQYENVETMRLDDRTGVKYINMSARLKRAKQWGADLILCIHHNAGEGTGVEVYQQYKDNTTLGARISSNMSDELKMRNRGMKRKQYPGRYKVDYFSMLRNAHCQSLLIEGGFMDKPFDVSIIKSTKGQMAYAKGIEKALAIHFNLKKSVVSDKPLNTKLGVDDYYVVQLGAYKSLTEAQNNAKRFSSKVGQPVGIKLGSKFALKWIDSVK